MARKMKQKGKAVSAASQPSGVSIAVLESIGEMPFGTGPVYLNLACTVGQFDPLGTTMSIAVMCEGFDAQTDLPPAEKLRQKTVTLSHKLHGNEVRKIRFVERCRLIVKFHKDHYRIAGQSHIAAADKISCELAAHDLAMPIDPKSQPRAAAVEKIVKLCDGKIPGKWMIKKILDGYPWSQKKWKNWDWSLWE